MNSRLLALLIAFVCVASAHVARADPTTTTAPASRPTTQPVERRRVHVFVSGRVQGVGFRAFVQAEAQRRQIAGWVRNLPDGRVEATAEGDGKGITELLDQIRKGPSAARVDAVHVEDETPRGERKPFEIAG